MKLQEYYEQKANRMFLPHKILNRWYILYNYSLNSLNNNFYRLSTISNS